MSWNQGFGVNKYPDDASQSLKDLAYPANNDSEKPKIKLLIDKRKFYCAQLKGIKSSETSVFDMISISPEISLHITDFLAYEREFVQNLKIVENEIIPKIKGTKYERVEKVLFGPMAQLREKHLKLLLGIESLFLKKIDNSIFEKFVQTFTSDETILQAHQLYMNSFLDVETLANSFSLEFSEQFYQQLGHKTIIQLLHMPLPWQNYTYEFAVKLSELISKQNQAQGKALDDFATQIKLLTESIDCIPQLEAISKLFVTEPFPIVVGGRRILKRGSAFKHCRSNITKREIILFSDIFMYAQLNCGKYLAPAKYELATMEVKVEEESQPHLAVFAPKKSFVLQFANTEERDSWYNAMKQAIENAQSTYEGELDNIEHAPIWYADSSQKECMECKKPFNPITRRRHHCRICGRVLCADCVPNKIIIPNISTTKPEKVCNNCYIMKKAKESSK